MDKTRLVDCIRDFRVKRAALKTKQCYNMDKTRLVDCKESLGDGESH